jgi:very-short-patch-repair endonuclease
MAFDFAWPARMIALEIEGGTHSGGRHTTAKGFSDDCEKYNIAAIRGWRVIRATGEHVKKGIALAWLLAAMTEPKQEDHK